jgi:hypothetical protein
MLSVVPEQFDGRDERAAVGGSSSLIDEIVRDGARQMLAVALQAEVVAYVEAHADQLDPVGHRLVVRNGYPRPPGRDHRGRRGAGPPAEDQRQAGRSGHRGAPAVLLGDPAGLVA